MKLTLFRISVVLVFAQFFMACSNSDSKSHSDQKSKQTQASSKTDATSEGQWKTTLLSQPIDIPLNQFTESTSCDQCFPIESLPENLRPYAKRALLHAMDQEGLFTLTGDLKPMSDVLVTPEYDREIEGIEKLSPQEVNTINQALTCGQAQVQIVLSHLDYLDTDGKFIFAQVNHHIDIFRSDLMIKTLHEHQDLVAPLRFDSSWSPNQIVSKLDSIKNLNTFEIFGYLVGYPKHAVEFYTQAHRTWESTGKFVERDTVQIPTHVSDTGIFVYVVPKGHVLNEIDLRIKTQAAQILKKYEDVRDQAVNDELGPVKILRDWYRNDDQTCTVR